METRTLLLALCLVLMAWTCVTLASDGDEDEAALDEARNAFVESDKAKTFLRVKRGWRVRVRFRRVKRLWGEERREENRKRERSREASHRAWINSHCPANCWSPWSAWTGCNHRCGSTGMQTSTRRRSPPAACSSWGGACPGSSSRTQPCNRNSCQNNGTPRPGGCACQPGFKGTCCENRITCSFPGQPSNGKVSPGGSVHNYGVTVRYTCNTGYRLVGGATRQCTATTAWSGASPSCQIIKCPNPGGIANGNRQGTDFSYGKSVVYTCNNGYRMTGSNRRTCTANGQWSTGAPSCNPVPCPKLSSPSGGSLSAPSSAVYGNTATYSCSTGYYMQGSRTRSCLASGQWGGSQPACIRITCPTLPTIQHGTVSPRTASHGGKATYSCNTGYNLVGNRERTCGGSGPTGVWSGSQPSCNAVYCGNPGTPVNGNKVNSTYTYNHIISFQCLPGYFMTGTSSVKCQASGSWSATKPSCTVCQINTYKAGSNSQKVCNSCPAHSHTLSTASSDHKNCLCNVGYRGPPGGPCTEIRCAALVIPAHGHIVSCDTRVNGACVFECTNGFIVTQGDRNRKCGLSGTWSGATTVCTACPKDTFKSGAVSCSPCPSNTHTTGTGNVRTGCVCNLGYRGPNGGPCNDVNECATNKGGCEQQCQNTAGSYKCACNIPGFGVDPADSKKCVATRTCTAFPKPNNGGAVCNLIYSTNTRRCQVKCNAGYDHLDKPNPYEQCGPDTDWQWSFDVRGGDIPPCVEEFFPGVQNELEMFYFISECTGLTAAVKMNIRRAFVNMLRGQGVCKQGTQDVCAIDDVRINCGKKDDFGFGLRKKRSTTDIFVLDIKFNLKVREVASRNINCGEYCQNVSSDSCKDICRDSFKNDSISKITTASTRLQQIFKENVKIPNNETFGRPGSIPQNLVLKVGRYSYVPASPEVRVQRVKFTCDRGTVPIESGNKCVACPPGTYTSRNECRPCPMRTHQPRPRQTRCWPCPPRSTTVKVGSKSCVVIAQFQGPH